MSTEFKTQKLSSIIFTFTGLTLSVTVFLVGSNAGINLPLTTGIIVIIIGNNIIIALYSDFTGVMLVTFKKCTICELKLYHFKKLFIETLR